MSYTPECKTCIKSYFKNDYITNDNIYGLVNRFIDTLEVKYEIKISKLYKVIQVTGENYSHACKIVDDFFQFCIIQQRQEFFKEYDYATK